MTQDTKRWTPEAREAEAARAREKDLAQQGLIARTTRTRRFVHEALADALANLKRPMDDSLELEST